MLIHIIIQGSVSIWIHHRHSMYFLRGRHFSLCIPESCAPLIIPLFKTQTSNRVRFVTRSNCSIYAYSSYMFLIKRRTILNGNKQHVRLVKTATKHEGDSHKKKQPVESKWRLPLLITATTISPHGDNY